MSDAPPQLNEKQQAVVASSPPTPENNDRQSRSPLREMNPGSRRRRTNAQSQPVIVAPRNDVGSLRHAQSQPTLDEPTSAQSSPARPPSINYCNLRYELMSGKRINSKLLHTIDEHQLYVQKVKTKSTRQYDCYKKKDLGCEAKVFVNNSSAVCFRKINHGNEHNHSTLKKEINEIKMKTEIKTKCGDSATLAEHIGASGTGNVRGIFQHFWPTHTH